MFQMLGLTATIGIGDAKSLNSAKDFIIGMCAKFGLEHPPSHSEQIIKLSQEETAEGNIVVVPTV